MCRDKHEPLIIKMAIKGRVMFHPLLLHTVLISVGIKNNSVVLKPSLEFPEVTQTTCEVFSPIFLSVLFELLFLLKLT